MSINQLIAEARTNLSLNSTNELALQLRISPSLVYRWEKGDGLPNEENVVKIAESAGIDPILALIKLRIASSEGHSKEVESKWRELELRYLKDVPQKGA